MAKLHKSRIPVEKCEEAFLEFIDFDWSSKHSKFEAAGVYIIDLIGTPFCKVGSTNTPVRRFIALAHHFPFDISMPFFVTGNGGISHIQIEKTAHKLMSPCHKKGEWFDCSVDEAILGVRHAVDLAASQ